MRANVKPLMHWIIYRGYRVRFTARTPSLVTGILSMSTGEVTFHYDPVRLEVFLPNERIQINEHGWELSREAANGEK